MTLHIRFFTLATIIALVLSACTISSTPTPEPPPPGDPNPVLPNPTPVNALELLVNTDLNATYDTVGQTINYLYQVKNISGAPLPGPVTIADDKVTPTCPAMNTVGNLDDNLDADETVTCTGAYAVTQADLDAGTVATVSTASAGGSVSGQIPTTVPMIQNKALTLSKTADPNTYNSLGQFVVYSYTITNSGNVTLGPAQFVVNDDKISTPINCGSPDASLAPNTTAACSATYTITQADLDAGSVTSNATATDGTTTSPSIATTLNKDSTISLELVADPNLAKGSTVSHSVVKGEWLWQIARCYGAAPKQTILSNSQLSDPAKIDPGITVTVPNIGSERTIYGPQIGDDQVKSCVPTYEVQSGDTWESIAAKFKASPSLLREVNPGVTISTGIRIRVPINSVGD